MHKGVYFSMFLSIIIKDFYHYYLVFTSARNKKNNTSKSNSNKPKITTFHHIYTRGGKESHINQIVQNLNFIIQKNYRTTKDLTEKVVLL